MRHLYRTVVVLSALLALASVGVWFASLGRQSTLSDFADGVRQIDFGHGWIYIRRHPTPDAQTLALRQRVEELGREQVNNHVLASVTFTSTGSGDRFILFGWSMNVEMRSVGGYSAEFNRQIVYWISPWLGVMPAVILFLTVMPRRVWGNRVYYKRIRNNQCSNCGYDLTGSNDRCPECGIARAPADAGAA
jgi:hypothetical protein